MRSSSWVAVAAMGWLGLGVLTQSGCKGSANDEAGAGGPNASSNPSSSASAPGPIPAPTTPVPPPVNGASCRGEKASTFAPQTNVSAAPALTLPSGFVIEKLVDVSSPRHIAALPNGDLLVGTQSDVIFIVPGAEADGPSGAPQLFAKMPESQAHGIALAGATCTIYVGTPQGVYAMPYTDAQTSAVPAAPIAKVRPGGVNGHTTTSVAFSQQTVYASVGSSCNACVETDPTRATVQTMAPNGANMATRAKRIRNAIAVAVNPETSVVWAGGAGQDNLPEGHPFEFMDPISTRPGVPDYGWPDCEENKVAYKAGADCSSQVVPLLVVPAYATILAAAFYPTNQTGTFAFPAQYRGMFLSLHGSWHENGGKYIAPPRVLFVSMNGDAPKTPVDWNDPNKQHNDFVSGYQLADGATRIGRPSGVAVGSRGSLFVADDQAGAVYRIRPKL